MAKRKATKRRKRRKSSVAGSTTTIAGQKFSKVSCHTTKSAAKAKAKAIRASGFNARVVDKCVLKGRRKKK